MISKVLLQIQDPPKKIIELSIWPFQSESNKKTKIILLVPLLMLQATENQKFKISLKSFPPS
jgi:hypothetical protein